MLEFFRTYQRYFFMVITVVVVISFSFFGTYSTLGSDAWREQVAFRAVDGSDITRNDVEEMSYFLSTDNHDKLIYGGAWGPNFLNDGVIQKDFLETGLALPLIAAYATEFQGAWQQKMAKEKTFSLYTHPQAPFISVSNVWIYFDPSMKTNYDKLRSSANPLDTQGIESRVQLYLSERRMPQQNVKQILRYQERQYDWLSPDHDLDRMDLSLFGYHTLSDWFGTQFPALVSEFIINTALVAQQKGYHVSQAEAMADLIRNTQTSYQQSLERGSVTVASPEEYFNEQLRLMRIDQSRAIKIWQQVLLFRRYFQDAGNSAIVAAAPLSQLNDYASQTVQLETYRLPFALHLSDFDALKQFQTYLTAVSSVSNDSLTLPEKYRTAAEVSKTAPELVQKRYVMEVASVSQKDLQAKVGMREMWKWEADEKNWPQLKTQFPELGLKDAPTVTERLAMLDNLSTIARGKVDSFARQMIVRGNPELISQALAAAPLERKTIGISTEGGKHPLPGLSESAQRKQFMKLLDAAALGSMPNEGEALFAYSPSDEYFYRIAVIERANAPEILTFAQAKQEGALKSVHDKTLESYYVANRDKSPLLYKNEQAEWRPFAAVQELVADSYFENLVTALHKVDKEVNGTSQDKKASKDQLATVRFYPHMKAIKAKVEKDPAQEEKYVRANDEASLKTQWLLEKASNSINRKGSLGGLTAVELFELAPQSWSAIKPAPNGDILFAKVIGQGTGDAAAQSTAVIEQARAIQKSLSLEVQGILMRNLIQMMEEKKAISLNYLNKSAE